MKGVIFTSVAFGEQYVEQLKRLEQSINTIYPENNSKFWIDELPKNSKPFLDSLYGFKVHAVRECLEMGFKKIIFFDPACILVDKVEYYFDIIDQYGIMAARDENLLANCTCDVALDYFGVTRKDVAEKKQHLVGGSLYLYNFELPLCNDIFELWANAERDGIFGSQNQMASEQLPSHRNDETCLSHSLYNFGSRPVPYDVCRYGHGENIIVKKDHFK